MRQAVYLLQKSKTSWIIVTFCLGGWPLVSPLAGWKQETTGARIRFLSEATIYVRIDLSPINL